MLRVTADLNGNISAGHTSQKLGTIMINGVVHSNPPDYNAFSTAVWVSVLLATLLRDGRLIEIKLTGVPRSIGVWSK